MFYWWCVCFRWNESAEDTGIRDKRRGRSSETISSEKYDEIGRFDLEWSPPTATLKSTTNGLLLGSENIA